MVKNFELRFKTTKELIEKDKLIYEKVGSDLKRTAWMEKVYINGLDNIQKQILEQKKDILSKLVKETKQ